MLLFKEELSFTLELLDELVEELLDMYFLFFFNLDSDSDSLSVLISQKLVS